ncbi:hypothetical protein [Amycolatopsis sp. VC5-11]|uniref:hypothetical protein n=1 Tax=Amycolatopsis sp. VC5-11 TaxID=3120156 RepID=UPI0030093547
MADQYNLADLLPEGAVPLGFVASVAALVPDSDQTLYYLAHEVMPWEAIGMLTSHLDDQRRWFQSSQDGLDLGDGG